jgi:predicted ATP-dependent serine protease
MSPVIPQLFSTVIKKPVKRYYRTTGVPALDQLIYGWPRKGLALIYGSQKAGKTTLALQAAVTTALEEGKILMLDTESGGIGELKATQPSPSNGCKGRPDTKNTV